MRKIILMLLVSLAMVSQAKAELRIDVSGAKSDPMPIAIPTFLASDKEVKVVAEDITRVIMADLERSGLFEIMNQNGFIQKFTSVDSRPKFNDWQAINAQALIQGAVEQQNDGKVKVSFRLWECRGWLPYTACRCRSDPTCGTDRTPPDTAPAKWLSEKYPPFRQSVRFPPTGAAQPSPRR